MDNNPVISKILTNEEHVGGTKVSLVILAENRESQSKKLQEYADHSNAEELIRVDFVQHTKVEDKLAFESMSGCKYSFF